jgi:FlaA1/EpsC-like NDP-sugar epimerase
MLVSVLLISFSIRLGYWYFPPNSFMFWLIFGAPIIACVVFSIFGLYRSVTRYIGYDAIWLIVKGITLYSLIWVVLVFLAQINGIPRTIVLLNWALSILIISGWRMVARWLFTTTKIFQKNNQSFTKKRALIYGAGAAGRQLVGALNHSHDYRAVGFIDDLDELKGTNIWGLEVFSADVIREVIDRLKVDVILVAMPSVSRARRFAIVTFLEPYSVQVRMLPGVSDLAGGKVDVDDLREVRIEDLLGREKVIPNQELLSKNIKNKSVIVTGAGGSIGSELSRQILLLNPKTLVLFEMSELALYTIERDLKSLNTLSQINIYPVLGSVNNTIRLNKVLKHFKVNTLYHAAAYKHVPIVEFNNAEGVDNNIFGTLNCAQAAIDNNVETFVLISTDKAVRPTNTMGASKRSAELILQALSKIQSITKFTMVRFGNVLDSSGSVIPLFKEQIKEGGPLTVTDKNIIRYFMTISEAVELVIQAGAMGTGGDVFILDMGEPVSIDDLAKKMIKLSGLEVKDKSNPDGDIEIQYIGLRPGEKLYEELLLGDNCSNTDNPLIMRAEEDMILWDELKPILESLKKEVLECDQEKIRKLLIRIVPCFKPLSDISDILYKK